MFRQFTFLRIFNAATEVILFIYVWILEVGIGIFGKVAFGGHELLAID